jgi:hypothetical protein
VFTLIVGHKEATNGSAMTKNFAGLTDKQAAVFEQIAVSNDAGHNPRTLESLERKGFIERYGVNDGAFTIFHYFVPIPIHMEWCQWCTDTLGEEDEGPDS